MAVAQSGRKSGNVSSLISKFRALDENSVSFPNHPTRTNPRRHTVMGVNMKIPPAREAFSVPNFAPKAIPKRSSPSAFHSNSTGTSPPSPEQVPTQVTVQLRQKPRPCSFIPQNARISETNPKKEEERKRNSALFLTHAINRRATMLDKPAAYSPSNTIDQSKKESAIADLKRRTDQRKAELTRIQSMPNGGTSGAAAARKKFMSRLGEDNPENRKLRRSNTISGGGPTGVKSLLLKWCQVRCKDYPVEVNNYSSSWADGSAFCALTHSFFPDAFKWDDVILNTDNNDERRKNFSLAFDTALEKADAEPLIEVEDMIFMGNRPDAKCIFCYLQSLYNKLRKFEQPIEKKDLDV